MTERPIAFFDADCGFCTATTNRLQGWGVAVDFEALQRADLAGHGVDPQRAREEMALAETDGTVHYGHHAWARILRRGNLVWQTLGRGLDSRLAEWPGRTVYRLVASNRGKLPGSDGTCALPDRSVPAPGKASST